MNYNVILAMHSNVWLFHMLVWFVRQQLVSVALLTENFMLVDVASLTKLVEQDLNLHLVCRYLLKIGKMQSYNDECNHTPCNQNHDF